MFVQVLDVDDTASIESQYDQMVLQYIIPNNHCVLGDAYCLFSATDGNIALSSAFCSVEI